MADTRPEEGVQVEKDSAGEGVGEVTQEDAPQYSRVVVIGVDGSPMAWYAFTYYIDHLHQTGNYVVITHAFEIPMLHSFQEMYVSPEMWQSTLKREADRTVEMETCLMENLREHGIPGKFVARGGKPGEVVVSVAEEEGAVLIVVGARGQGKLRKTIMGSVSGYVSQHAPCPVVICRKRAPKSRPSSESSNPRSRHNSGSEIPSGRRVRHSSLSESRCDDEAPLRPRVSSTGSDCTHQRRRGLLSGLLGRSHTSSGSADHVAQDSGSGLYRKVGEGPTK